MNVLEYIQKEIDSREDDLSALKQVNEHITFLNDLEVSHVSSSDKSFTVWFYDYEMFKTFERRLEERGVKKNEPRMVYGDETVMHFAFDTEIPGLTYNVAFMIDEIPAELKPEGCEVIETQSSAKSTTLTCRAK